MQSGTTMADPKRFKFDARDFYLKSPAEMRALWDRALPGACDNTLAIAERIGDYAPVFAHRNLMPQFPVPAGRDRGVVPACGGAARTRRTGSRRACRRRTCARPTYELDVICQMGFPGYFLVVADLCAHARARGHPGRSGARFGGRRADRVRAAASPNSIRSQHGLIFERFLNPERISMPDIDLDFDERRRGDMIRYATEKYGEERVAQIVTYGTIKAKAGVKDAARVLGYPFALGERITKALPPPVMGKDIPLSGVFDPDHPRYAEAAELRSLYETDPDVTRVVDTARGLEGLKRQVGVHAAGVILSGEPLLDVVPIWRRDQDGAIITQFDMGACEYMGLLKMDFLGLRNLTVLDDCLESIKDNRGLDLVLEELPLDDKVDLRAAVPWRHARRLPARRRPDALAAAVDGCRTTSSPSRPCSRSTGPVRWVPTRTTTTPIARTAANRWCRSTPSWPSRWRRSSDDSYGLIVYQEQVMAIAQKRGRLLARQRRSAAPRDGQEEEGDPRQGVRAVRRRHDGPTDTPRARSRRCGTSWSRSPTTRSTRRTPPATAWSPTGPAT